MPDYQSSGNVLAAIKREADMGVAAAAGAGAFLLPLTDSPGLVMSRGRIESARRRRDRVRPHGRLGSKDPDGTYNMEILPGGAIDLLLESALRGTYSAALVTVLGAAEGTTTANTIVRSAGSWLTDGFRSGDVVTISGDSTAANNDLRVRLTDVTATTLTLAGTPLTVNAVARAFTVTRLKKVMTPVDPVYHSYTIEQYDADIDQSELFLGQRLTGLSLAMRANAMTTAAATFMGLDRDIVDVAAAPYFTDPLELDGSSLVADDSWIRYKGEDVVHLTGLDLSFAIAAARMATIGSVRSPDVFMNDLTITGSVTAIRRSLQALQDFDAETEFEVQVLLVSPDSTPKPAIGVYLPSVRVAGIDAPFLGGDGAKVETRSLTIAPHAGDTDTDETAAVFFTSGA